MAPVKITSLNTASFVITGLDETSYATSSTSSKTPYFPY
jgi:hypothetical protein